MPVVVKSLTELDVDAVQQAQALNRQLIQEDNPTIDVFGGVIDELVIYYGAVFAAANQENLDLLNRSGSLLEIEADPTLADETAVDNVLSNFQVTRQVGTNAHGEVQIIVDTLETVSIANNAIFTANGKQFTADESYVAKTSSANVSDPTDRVLTQLNDGTYAFTISVTAVEVGADSMLSRDTLIVPEIPPLNFLKAQAASDFVGGVDPETNAQLLTKLVEGPAVKALSGPVTMRATLKSREAFKNVLASSIVGFGDQEMLRDKHWIWPGGGGGRTDWYVRTQERVQHLALTLTAKLVEKTVDNKGIWQFQLSDDAYGFYDVLTIEMPDGTEQFGSLVVTEDIRGFDLTGDGILPDVVNAAEATYTKFQTSTIKFLDDVTDTGDLTVNSSTQDYLVVVRVMPMIADIQDDLGSRGTRNTAGDLLIKAPVPCFLQLSFTINKRSGSAEPDTAAIADALASVVNNYGFTGRLPASVLTDTIHNFLTSPDSVGAVDMFGKIRYPDGTVKALRSSTILTMPDEPSRMVSPRTVVFFLDPSDVDISIETVSLPET